MTILINKLYLLFVLFLSMMMLAIIFSWQAHAVTEFNYSEKRKIEATIATNELNRIGVVGGEIIEVIGDESKYTLYWSGDWRNLFIKPKIEVGETIDLSLVMPGGLVQDIRFTALDMASQTILLNLHNRTRGAFLASNRVVLPHFDQQLKSAVSSMIRAMIEGVNGKYYVIDVQRIVDKTKQQVVKQSKAYRYGDLTGAVLSVKNLSSEPLPLQATDFSNLFKNTIAINLGTNLLAKGASSQLLIISKVVDDD